MECNIDYICVSEGIFQKLRDEFGVVEDIIREMETRSTFSSIELFF